MRGGERERERERGGEGGGNQSADSHWASPNWVIEFKKEKQMHPLFSQIDISN